MPRSLPQAPEHPFNRIPAYQIARAVGWHPAFRSSGTLVVPREDQARRTIEKQIEQLVQLNEGHAYTDDRETLIEMLDEALASSRPRTRGEH
jgi:hypothetical protein